MLEFTVLCINSDTTQAKTLMNTLDLPEDLHIIYSDSGLEALSILSDHHIHLIIISENLAHKMSATEVCTLLLSRPETTSIPILYLSDVRPVINANSNFTCLSSIPDRQVLQEHVMEIYYHARNTIEIQFEKNLVLSIVNKIHSPIFIISYDTITFANQYFLDFFGLESLEDFSLHYNGIADLFLYDKEEELTILEWLKALLHENKELKATMRNSNNETMIVKVHAEVLQYSNKNLIITQDITDEIAHEEEIKKIFKTDALTKLPNRSKLIEDLKEYDELALAILDIDSFKMINDFYGHVIGDFIILEVAKRIAAYISHENLRFYRLPADTFAIVNKTHIQAEYFELIIISLIQIISKSPFIYINEQNEEMEVYVNLTAGIVFHKDLALAHADLALREAKSTHKDYVIYTSDIRKEIEFSKNMEWIKKIKTAISHDRIVPYFQPIVENESKKTIKYECLVRLIDEDDNIIPPSYFLEIAKHSKLYESISKIMIKKSFQAFMNTPYEFSINLSIEDIIEYKLFEYIKSMLVIYPLANQVCFEILETEEINNYDVISTFVQEVRNLGCKVSIDDFGSGYSNFSHLLNLDFDYLKIDASLIHNIHQDKNKQVIVKTIVTFAKQLNIKTIGEFVESKEIYDYIKAMGIDYSQGYYFSKPVATIT